VKLPGQIVAKVWQALGLFGGAWHSAGVKEPRGELVAVVEDEKNIRETVVFAVKREGYRVNSYADGAEAWSAFRQQLPDLAVLDILLPRMDGRELCRKLRSRSEALPIIFLTSTACSGSSSAPTTISASPSQCASS
jgi:DNA-binding NtrC family response regulator